MIDLEEPDEFEKAELGGWKRCNFCYLRDIRASAGDKPVVLTDRDDGIEVQVDGAFVVWFMKLPEECAC